MKKILILFGCFYTCYKHFILLISKICTCMETMHNKYFSYSMGKFSSELQMEFRL